MTTGTFLVTELQGYDQLATELQRLRPEECILPREEEDPNLRVLLDSMSEAAGTSGRLFVYTYATKHDAYQTLQKHFSVHSLDAFGIQKWPFAIQAAGLLLNYLKDTQKTELAHLKGLRAYTPSDHMLLDESTLKNLELLSTLRDQKREGSLLGVLDRTQTAMGGRLLKQWILRPLTHPTYITERLDAVDHLWKESLLRQSLGEQITLILDLERVVSRVSLDRGTPRDLVALKNSLRQIPEIKKIMVRQSHHDTTPPLLQALAEKLDPLPELVDLLSRALLDEPPMAVRDGGFIREGFSADLDQLRTLAYEGKSVIKSIEQREVQRTGINSLKVKYNKVFGYYIEISNANLNRVPTDYTRKQTLVNAERFVTPELKEHEEKVMSADEKSKALEYELFKELREQVMEDMRAIQVNAEAIATLDVLMSFAEVAALNRYVKPELNQGKGGDGEGELVIREGRHPVVEQVNPAGDFVPNDTHLGGGAPDSNAPQIHLITGPNMSGKSTLLRQVALISLMAQIGSFVPAKAARLPVVDRIFTRVGASDNLVRGESTFMVEMQEAANILNNATARSLVILDEIGRGTSTYDGVSIAWAILEYLHDRVGAKTLFATHYHELIAVAERLPRAKNYCVAVEENSGAGVVFLHKIIEGGIDKSYGIEVAKLAGLPSEVITKAQHILSTLEEGVVEKGIAAQLAREP
ncbi:MAG: DNA mismatch repair protein MutS, partial [Verrucomicrobiota bacterium]